METKTFNIIKKNRKYFAATVNGYKCKIMIDDNSQALEVGEHELIVDDISKRTKYGTDLIFKLAAEAQKQQSAGIVTLSHHTYNSKLVAKCRAMGGRWDAETDCWVFSELVEDRVEQLDEIYNSPLIPVEITALSGVDKGKGPVSFCGYTIARAYGRDSGAKLGDGISQISGSIYSGGSVKNWKTCISEGAVFRLYIPEELLMCPNTFDRHYTSTRNWKITIL